MLSEIDTERAVNDVTDDVCAEAIENFALSALVNRTDEWRASQVQVDSKAERDPAVEPCAVFVPPSSRRHIGGHQGVRLAHLDGLPAVKECICRCSFGYVYRKGVHVRLFIVEPGRHGAH